MTLAEHVAAQEMSAEELRENLACDAQHWLEAVELINDVQSNRNCSRIVSYLRETKGLVTDWRETA